MLKIRLQRVGKKHEPVFRLVVCDSKNGVRSGNNLEILGSYDPRDKNQMTLNSDKINHWISKGAKVSDTVHNLLVEKGVIKGKKINILPAFKAPEKPDGEVEGATPVVEVEKTESPVVEKSEEVIEEKIETPVEDSVEIKEVEIPAEVEESKVEDSIEVKEEEIPAETK